MPQPIATKSVFDPRALAGSRLPASSHGQSRTQMRNLNQPKIRLTSSGNVKTIVMSTHDSNNKSFTTMGENKDIRWTSKLELSASQLSVPKYG